MLFGVTYRNRGEGLLSEPEITQMTASLETYSSMGNNQGKMELIVQAQHNLQAAWQVRKCFL